MTTRPPADPLPGAHEDTAWQVFCLCAAWCGVCGQWRSDFEQLAAAHPALQFRWVDIEDEADRLGDVEVETFPTLLVAHGGQPRFFGPVQPQAGAVARLLASLQAQAQHTEPDPAARELLTRLRGVL